MIKITIETSYDFNTDILINRHYTENVLKQMHNEQWGKGNACLIKMQSFFSTCLPEYNFCGIGRGEIT